MMSPAEFMTETGDLEKSTLQLASQNFPMPTRVFGKLGMTRPGRASSGMVGKASFLLAEEYWIWPVAVTTKILGAADLTLEVGACLLK